MDGIFVFAMLMIVSTAVQMLEVRQRPHDVKMMDFQAPDLGTAIAPPTTITTAVATSDEVRSNEEENDNNSSSSDNEEKQEADGADKRKLASTEVAAKAETYSSKRQKNYNTQMVARLNATIRGHTAFLTFAIKAPSPTPVPAAAAEHK